MLEFMDGKGWNMRIQALFVCNNTEERKKIYNIFLRYSNSLYPKEKLVFEAAEAVSEFQCSSVSQFLSENTLKPQTKLPK
jgi:hypothetical protein